MNVRALAPVVLRASASCTPPPGAFIVIGRLNCTPLDVKTCVPDVPKKLRVLAPEVAVIPVPNVSEPVRLMTVLERFPE